MGRRRIITVIFGETDDTTVLGVTALESFGLEVDPVRGTLKEAELLIANIPTLIVTPPQPMTLSAPSGRNTNHDTVNS